MAQTFGQYSPAVSLALPWKERFQLFQDNPPTTPVNLTGLAVRAQLRPTRAPVVDLMAGAPNPVLEITTVGWYGSAPAWPVIEGFTITDAVNGIIDLLAPFPALRAAVAPKNARIKLYWQIVVVSSISDDRVPVVFGRPLFIPWVTQ